MRISLLRNATLATVLLVAGAAFAQGPGRHGPARAAPAAAPAGLGYGAGYHARRMQQAERKEPGRNPAPARRDTCVATKP